MKEKWEEEWNGIKEVEKILKISNGNISECCRGNRKTAGGYIWRYEQWEKKFYQ